MGLSYLEDENKVGLYLQANGANLTNLIERKVMYVFLKTNIILELEVVYLDRYNIEYVKFPRK